MTAYSFPSSKFTTKLRTAVVTGVARSGKTTLGNILATYKNVEQADEPWLLNTLPIMPQLNLMEKTAAGGMFSSYLDELANDMILLRYANFRPSDLSSIWSQKTPTEITSRLIGLQTRADVREFLKKNKSLFLLILNAEPVFNMLNFFDFLSQTKMVYVVRKGLELAHNIEQKKWLSDKDLARPPHAQIFRTTKHRGKTFYAPCWIQASDEEKFFDYTQYERALFYWCVLAENAIKTLPTLQKKKQVIVVKFEELIQYPRESLEMVAGFLRIEPTIMTDSALLKLKQYQPRDERTPIVSKELLQRTKILYNHFGYDWN